MVKKLVCIIVVVAFMATIMAGCGPATNTNDPSNSTQTTSSNDNKEVIDISIGTDTDFTVADDDIGKELQNKLKINFKVVNVKDSLQVMKSADELPDIFHLTIGDPTYDSFIENKLIRNISGELLANYANTKKLVDDNPYISTYGKKNNNQYVGIPSPSDASQPLKATNAIFSLRWDWAQNVGVTKLPETTDELYELLKKYTTADPDQNQVADDTCGFTGKLSAANFAPWIDINSWVKEGDTWIPAYLSQGMLPALKYWNKLAAEKILPDGFASSADVDDFSNDYSGCYVQPATALDMWTNYLSKWGAAHKDYLATSKKKAEDCIKEISLLKVDANTPAKSSFDYDKTITAVSAKVDDNKLKRILEFYEYALSPEGQDFAHFGMENTTYVMSDGAAFMTLPPSDTTYGAQKSLAEVYPSVQVFKMIAGDTGYHLQSTVKIYPDWVVANQKQAYDNITKSVVVPNILISTLSTPAKKANASISNMDQIQQDLAAIVAGTNVDADFAAFVEKYKTENQCQAVIDEVNAKVKADGLEAAQ